MSDSEAQGKEELFGQLNMELKVRGGRRGEGGEVMLDIFP